ncbi:MAG: GNAT family N-acetyltransferase, partial [Solirubrobacterales bacterium]
MDAVAGPPPLTTERLRLRPLGPADLDPLFEIYSDPETMRYWSSPPYEDRAQAEEMLARIERNFASGEVHVWGIERFD